MNQSKFCSCFKRKARGVSGNFEALTPWQGSLFIADSLIMASNRNDYSFLEIEPKWQNYWAQQHTYRAQDFADQPTFYVLDMFPYPSGAGLHIGHLEGYTASDALKR